MLKKIISIFITLLFVLVITNKAVYLHVHELSNGKMVVHAHPYNKTSDNDPVKKHQHSKVELLFLSNFDLLFFTCLLIVITTFLCKSRKTLPVFARQVKAVFYQFTLLRAPPFLLS